MTLKKDYSKTLWLLWNSTSQTLEEISDKELADYARKQGKDIEAEVQPLRALIASTLKDLRMTRLRQAEKDYHSSKENLTSSIPSLPESAELRRAFLFNILNKNPEVLATMHFRDYKSMNDEEVASALKDLYVLGIWKENSKK